MNEPLDASKTIGFLKLAGALKSLERFRGQFFWRDYPQQERYESVADHTWRMALMLILVEKSLSKPIDLGKALKMTLIHDLGEAITGDWSPLGSDGTGNDSHLYNKEKAEEKFEGEKKAIEKLLSALPAGQAQELMGLWLEFEEQKSFEARAVKAMDKIEGKLQASEYLKGHMFEKHLDFSLKYGVNTFDADPAIKELGLAVNEELKKDYKEYIPAR